MKHIFCILSIVWISSFSIKANSFKKEKKIPFTNGFIENKGQIHDQNFNPRLDVKFLLKADGLNLQLKTNSFSYDTYTIEKRITDLNNQKDILKKGIFNFHRIDVEFINANPNPQIITEMPSSIYFNYYTSGASDKGVNNVRSFEKVSYKNLYPNIDLEFVAQNGEVKYNFILHFGADINQIRWIYNGNDGVTINNEKIQIIIKQGLLTERIPESYLNSNSGKGKSVKINYTKSINNVFGLTCNQKINLNVGQDLIIDPAPTIVWSTYKGGLNDEVLSTKSTDNIGNVYVCGWSSSVNSIATAGAYQISYGGGSFDAMILKYSNNGALRWGTYYGGTGDEQAATIAIDNSNNLFVCGPTTSTASISTPTVHQVNYGGGTSDGFLAKFDTSGVRQWGTYYGGTSYDDAFGCSVDKSGYVYLSGATSSTNGISTTGSHQVSFAGGPNDAYLVKFDNNGLRQWATYYGGLGDDQSPACTNDIIGNIYMIGFASSTVSISTVGSHQFSYGGGGYDGFLIKFNKSGVRQWGTYYGGNADDIPQYVYYDTLDINRGLFFVGNSKSTNSIASAGAYQTINNGGDDAFLVRFDTSGTRLWGTYLGGPSNDLGYSVTTDNANVYLVGITQSYSSIATANGLQTAHGGGSADGFITKFTKLGILQWSTYYGGSAYDLCLGATMDKFGNLFVAGTTSSNGMATVGAPQTVYGGGPHDGFCTKFNQLTPLSVTENIFENNNTINFYPNPNNGSFSIETKEDIILNIINELGQVVKIITLNNSNNHEYAVLDLPSGVYFISDKQTGRMIQNKIVVIK